MLHSYLLRLPLLPRRFLVIVVGWYFLFLIRTSLENALHFSALIFLLLWFGECDLNVFPMSQFKFLVMVFIACWFFNVLSHGCLSCASEIKYSSYFWFWWLFVEWKCKISVWKYCWMLIKHLFVVHTLMVDILVHHIALSFFFGKLWIFCQQGLFSCLCYVLGGLWQHMKLC